MEKECYDTGSCKLCGCTTTALQMANKPCDKPCYPPMFNGRQWLRFVGGAEIDGWKARTKKDYPIYREGSKDVKYERKIYYIYKNEELVHSKEIKEIWNGKKN